MNERTNESVVPFLARFAVPRTGDPEIPGHYDPAMNLWVIDGSAGPMPIVDSQMPLVELATKTEVVPEQDDPGSSYLSELATKTAARGEQDDLRVTRSWHLALETTTKIAKERVDF
jgi:hypothetical protein